MSDSYRPPAWLPGGHLQTIASSLVRWPGISYTRQRWGTLDNDFIDVDWAGPEDSPTLLVLFHGLEGNSAAPYARRLGRLAARKGWRFAVPHFRSCSGEPNRLLPDYHAGSSGEVEWILERFVCLNGGRPVLAAGVSLGANALLKFLGERPDRSRELVERAVAISATMDLRATGAALQRGFSILYSKLFLGFNLRSKALRKLDRFPGAYDRRCVRAAGTLRDFEDSVTAPVNGFIDARDYWQRASSLWWLPGISVPTLVINARNDPFQPNHVLQALETLQSGGRLDDDVQLEFPEEGGHAGFPGSGGWLVKRVERFLTTPA